MSRIKTRRYDARLLNGLSEGVIVLDEESRVSFMNRAAGRIMGVRQGEGKNAPAEALFKKRNPDFYDLIRGARDGHDAPGRHEITYRKNGAEIKILVTITGNPGDGDMFVVITDITEIWRLHKKEKTLMNQLRKNFLDQMENLRQIADSVAHEVRNPIVSIGGYANLLLKRCDGRDKNHGEIKKYLDYIREDADRLNRIVARVESYADASEVRFGRENIVALLKEVYRFYAKNARRLGVILALPDGGEKEYPMYVDRGKLKAALKDLFRYSLSLCPAEGTIVVHHKFSPYELFLWVTVPTDKIREEDIPFLFNPLYTAGGREGSVDLAGAQRTIILHGGIIQAIHNDNGTVTFRLSLPKEKRLQPE